MISLKLKISGGRASLVYEYVMLVYRSVVSKGQKLFPACIPTVPDTEGCGRLVGEHHVVLCLVEHGLGLVLLEEQHGCQIWILLAQLQLFGKPASQWTQLLCKQ